MPFHLSSREGVLHLELTGVVINADLVTLAAEVIKFESGCVNVPHRVTNLANATKMELTFHDLWTLAEWRRAYPPSNQIKSAIVAVQPMQIGFARMFQALNDHPKVRINVFNTEALALAWIATND